MKLEVEPFSGEYNHALDAKSRIILPNKLREGLFTNSYVLVKHQGETSKRPCLRLYPKPIWDEHAKAMTNAVRITDTRGMQALRIILGGVENVIADTQGRIVLPTRLKDFAEIEDEVMIVGMGNAIEIWAKTLYEAEMNDEMSISDAFGVLDALMNNSKEQTSSED